MKSLRLLLLPFSLLYALATLIRNFLFDSRFLKSYAPPLPVICIGNLSVGGTGKTPHTEYLVRLLKANRHLATLSRGYGRSTTGFAYVSENAVSSACGDEPLQLKRKFGKELLVAVDEKREHGIRTLLQDHPDLDVILLDDAYQHRSVKAGLNILLTDFSNPYYRDYVLPAGNLREPRSGAKRADMVILTKCPHDMSDAQKAECRNKIPVKEVLFSAISYSTPRLVSDDREAAFPDNLTGILLLSGIANNGPFKNYLLTKTKQLQTLEFPDHHDYSAGDMEKLRTSFEAMSEKNNIIVTSEKDAMRLKPPEIQKLIQKFPVYYVPIHIKFSEDDSERFHTITNRYVEENKKRG
jgi:tetraacyldisaccharide 4'-kinase